MTKLTKHPRKTGATTVMKDGKIVGNIGKGKNNVPTTQKHSIQRLETKVNKIPENSPIAQSQKKFAVLSKERINYEQAQTLWNLTAEQNLVERLNIFSNYIDRLNVDDRNEMITKIGDEYHTYNPYEHMVQVLEGRMRESENIQPNVLDAFARCEISEWKRAVARNKNTMAETLDFLAEDNDTWLLENVTKNPRTTSQTLMKIFDKTRDNNALEAIAYNQNTSQKILTKLSKSETRVRINVAGHENTSTETLSYLSKDVESAVRHAVAQNWNTPPEILDNLSYDYDIDIVWCVADNSNTPYATLKRLAKNSNKEISNAAEFGLRYSTNLNNREKDNEHF